MRLLLIVLVFLCTLFQLLNVSAKTLVFDKNLIRANGIDARLLDDALHQHDLPHGVSHADLYINDKYILSGDIYSSDNKPAFTEAMLDKAGIKKNARLPAFNYNGTVYYLLKKKILLHYNRSDRALKLQIPPWYLTYPGNSNKISGGFGSFINYNSYSYHYSSNDSALQTLNTDYEVGVNVDNTIIRSHGSWSLFHDRNNRYQRNTLLDGYAEKDFGKFTFRGGRTLVNDGGFGTGYMDGAILSTSGGNGGAFVNFTYDAPEIVTIEFWQNNTLLWQENVQKGHVELKNIPVPDLTNDVMVLVKSHRQIIDSQIISRGQISTVNNKDTGWYAFSGKSINAEGEIVSGAGFNKNFGEMLRPALAIIKKEKYTGLSLSNAAEYHRLHTSLWLTGVRNEKKENGFNANATVSYESTSLSLSQSSHHFSYIDQARWGSYNLQRSSISIAQNLLLPGGIAGNISWSRYRFYNRASADAMSASVNVPIKRASLGVGISYMAQAPEQTLRNRLSVNLSLNIPLDFAVPGAAWRSQYYRYGDTSRLSHYASVPLSDYDTLTGGNNLQRSGSGRSNEYFIDNALITPYTSTDISLAQAHRNNNSSRTSTLFLSGAVAMNKKGVIFTPSHIKNTYAVVDTGVHHFLKVDSLQTSTLTNHDGKAIIASVAEKRGDFIRVNPEGLAQGTVIKNNVREFTARRGAVPYFNFEAQNNKILLVKWTNPPLWVTQSDLFYTEQGQLVARFIDDGILVINDADIRTLTEHGMVSPQNIHDTCRITHPLNMKENIIHAEFSCSQK